MTGPLTVTDQITANGQIVISDTTPTSATRRHPQGLRRRQRRRQVEPDGRCAQRIGHRRRQSVRRCRNPSSRRAAGSPDANDTSRRADPVPGPCRVGRCRQPQPALRHLRPCRHLDRLDHNRHLHHRRLQHDAAIHDSSRSPATSSTPPAVVQTLGAHGVPRPLDRPGAPARPKPTAANAIMLSSHDIEDVAPFAVTGNRDAVTDTGTVDPQQVDYPALVPLLMAALSQATRPHRRIGSRRLMSNDVFGDIEPADVWDADPTIDPLQVADPPPRAAGPGRPARRPGDSAPLARPARAAERDRLADVAHVDRRPHRRPRTGQPGRARPPRPRGTHHPDLG